MRTLHKAFTTKAEPVDDGQRGEFTALVSAFGIKDRHGEYVDKGAFTESLAEWAAKGRNIPVIWSHEWTNPDSFIGEYTSAEETEQGLLLKGVLDVDDNPRAARIYDLMRKGRVAEFSIGGGIRDWEIIERPDEEPEFHLTNLDLWEAGPCFKGVNPGTELESVKAAQAEQAEDFGKTLAHQFLAALKAAGEGMAEAPEDPAPEPEPGPPEETRDTDPGVAPHVRALLELTPINNTEGTV